MFYKIHDIFVYVIKRTVHGRLEIEQDMEFIFLCSNGLKTVNSWDIDLTVEDKFYISARPYIILIICHSSQRPLLKKNRESKIMYSETRPWYNQPLYNEKNHGGTNNIPPTTKRKRLDSTLLSFTKFVFFMTLENKAIFTLWRIPFRSDTKSCK